MTDGMETTWSADHLRVSLFASDVWSAPAESIFLEVFGIPPEATKSRPVAQESSAEGVWEELRLDVNRAFNRIDFIVRDMPTDAAGPMPLIKDVKFRLAKLSSVVAKWASLQQQGVIRIALGCNAFLRGQDVEDCYTKMKNLIKVIDVDVVRFKEFRFQVNLPVLSSVDPDLTINRLTNWASVALRAALIGVDAPRYFDEGHYISCSLDVNTDGERTKPISSELVEKITDELSSTCAAILDEGIS